MLSDFSFHSQEKSSTSDVLFYAQKQWLSTILSFWDYHQSSSSSNENIIIGSKRKNTFVCKLMTRMKNNGILEGFYFVNKPLLWSGAKLYCALHGKGLWILVWSRLNVLIWLRTCDSCTFMKCGMICEVSFNDITKCC